MCLEAHGIPSETLIILADEAVARLNTLRRASREELEDVFNHSGVKDDVFSLEGSIVHMLRAGFPTSHPYIQYNLHKYIKVVHIIYVSYHLLVEN